MIREAIADLVARNDIGEERAAEVMSEIMTGSVTEAQIAAFITALRMKGETVEEITGCARVMRRFATPIAAHGSLGLDREDTTVDQETILDTCGTGGDGTNTFNVSTATAFVVAACGLPVAKHGNRSVSSACGSADVLSALGVNIDVPPETVERCIREVGIGFLFAPLLHGAMKYAVGPRKQIGIRTIFNILGPLTNPAAATAQLLGVYSESLVMPMARVLKNLGVHRAWVVHGSDGMDEISLSGPTYVGQLMRDCVESLTISPEDYGFRRYDITAISGGDAARNAEIIRSVLNGVTGPRFDIVMLNAGAAVFVGGAAGSVSEGVKRAQAAVASGAARDKLDRLIALTNA